MLTTQSVSDYLREQFVTVKIDLTERGGPNNTVASEFGVQGIPTLFVFDQNAQIVDSMVGGASKSAFVSWIESCHAKTSG